MSDAPAATPEPTPPPPAVATPAPAPKRRFEPAVLPIVAAVVVLGGALAFLLTSPRERGGTPAREDRVAALEGRLAALEALPARIAPLENLPARIAPLQGLPELTAANERRIAAAEAAARDLANRPVQDEQARSGLAALRQSSEEAARAAEARDAALGQRLDESARGVDGRLGTLEGRVQEAERRAEARIAQAEATLANRLTGAEQSLAARVTAAEQAFAPRLQALDEALNQRVEAAGQRMNQRLEEAGRQLDTRAQQQETRIAERIAQFEERLKGAEAAERRLTVLAARGSLQTALEAGRPLGPALASLPGEAPVALTRYRETPPPSEAALRLSFEEAARAARAAAEPQGGTVGESALARLQGLVTVRRGEQVVVGDPVSGELERARRALDAGDLAGAVERLEKLPEPSRNAMAGWIGQARDLVEAQRAIRDIGTGGQGR